MDRRIVCFRVPAFEIALVRLADPSLRTRPVAIASRQMVRAVLRDVSAEAAADGLYPGMPAELARALCPSIELVPSNAARLRRGHLDILDVVRRYAPAWETIAPGRLYLDLTGTHRLFGQAATTAWRVEREVSRRRGVDGALGLAANKLVSHVAARQVPPAELHDVRAGDERIFLAPLAPTALPTLEAAAWRPTLEMLDDLNLTTLGAIADMPLVYLEAALGRQAVQLHHWAHGIDPTPVVGWTQQARLSVSVLLEPDEVEELRLLAHLYGMMERLCHALRRRHRMCRRIRLTVSHTDHVEVNRHRDLHAPTWWESDLFPHIQQMLAACTRRRVKVRTLFLEVDRFEAAVRQVLLFGETTGEGASPTAMQERAGRLAVALDRVRDRFGSDAIRVGRMLAAAPNGPKLRPRQHSRSL